VLTEGRGEREGELLMVFHCGGAVNISSSAFTPGGRERGRERERREKEEEEEGERERVDNPLKNHSRQRRNKLLPPILLLGRTGGRRCIGGG
jgi:hypothetical protein